jgi:NAD(P)-dependent dehydrogenase (short-subunit alcohol dehydrogenase family)
MSEERVVIATGAAGGLGSQAVKRLSARGIRVIAVDVNADGLEQVASAEDGGGEIVAHPADVTSEDDVKGFVTAALDRYGRLDAIFNNAAIQGHVGPFLEYEDEELWRIMRVNLYAAWLGMKHVLPVFIERGGGVIVNTGSSLAFRGWRNVPAYVASKHAVAGLTRSIAIEYGPHNVRANLLCPSSMDTQMLYDVAKDVGDGDADAGYSALNDLSPNGHIAPPGDVADVAVWLLLDAPPHLSGVTLPVDGAENAG